VSEPAGDLDRFFRQLVRAVAVADPHRVGEPLPLAEIRGSLLPYRLHRRALGVDSSEDYEVLLMRLAAGEGGLARVEPEAVRARLAAELASPHPDPAVLEEHEAARLVLNREPVLRALAVEAGEPAPDASARFDSTRFDSAPFAPAAEPPRPAPEPAREPEPESLSGAELEPAFVIGAPRIEPNAEPEPAAAGIRCDYCGGLLPEGRLVNFCPHCGQDQRLTRCPACRAEVEPAWRYCVSCGRAVGEGGPAG